MKQVARTPRTQPTHVQHTENHYCHGCRATQSFLDRGATLHCPRCERKLTRVAR